MTKSEVAKEIGIQYISNLLFIETQNLEKKLRFVHVYSNKKDSVYFSYT